MIGVSEGTGGIRTVCFVLAAVAASAQLFNDTNFKPTFQQCVRDASSHEYCATMPDWDVSRVSYMGSLCEKHVVDCTDFNVDISRWNVSAVTDMSNMLWRATAFNQDISGWQVGGVTDMSGMFYGCESFNQPIGGWDTSAVLDMQYMFYGANRFNGDISGWNVASVTHFCWMFYIADSFNQNIAGWDVRAAVDMSNMFQWAGAFDQDLSSWDPKNATDVSYMFNEASSFRHILCWRQLPALHEGIFTDSCGWVDESASCKPGRINPTTNCSHALLRLLL